MSSRRACEKIYRKLRGPVAGVWYSLYMVLDIFSRMVVGWTVAEREDALVAEQVLADAYLREAIEPEQLTVHADRGAPMTSKVLADLMEDLGITKSHSRPSVSDDNPYSEAQCAPRHAAVDRSRRELEREGRFQGHPPQAEPKGGADRSMVGTRLRLKSVAS